MRRRLLGTLSAAIVGGLLVVVPSTVEAAPVGTLTVPATVSGDVVVGVKVPDAAAYPFVQVKLATPALAVAPYADMVAIDPAPVANPGTALVVTVPTWGLTGDGVFVLLGCASADASTCRTLLARTAAAVSPSAPVDAQLRNGSSGYLFVPEQALIVAGANGAVVHNPGGGHLVAMYEDVVQPVANDDFTRLDGWAAPTWTGSVAVRRCSDLVDETTQGTAYCETVVAQDLTVITEPVLDLDVSRSVVSTDLSRSGSHVIGRATVVPTYLDAELSWRLEDGQGGTVAGPVAVTFPFNSSTVRFEIDPQRRAAQPLATGDYRLVLTETLEANGLTKSKDFSYPFRVETAPPADHPAVTTTSRLVWPSSEQHPGWTRMHYRVQGYAGSTATATVAVRDAAGRLVQRFVMGNPCEWVEGFRDYCTPFTWQLQIEASSRLMPPGRYTTVMTMPDSFGRTITVPLPSFTIQERAERQPRVLGAAARSDVDTGTVVGRCSRLRSTSRTVTLDSHARCGSHRRGADVVTRVFQLPLPSVTGYERFSDLTARFWYDRPQARGRVRAWVRVPAYSPRWVRLTEKVRPGARQRFGEIGFVPNTLVDVRGQVAQLRVRVARGARVTVRRVGFGANYDYWR